MDDRQRRADDIEAALHAAGRRLRDEGPSPDETDDAFRAVLRLAAHDEDADQPGGVTEVPLDDVAPMPPQPTKSPRWVSVVAAAAAVVLAALIVIPTVISDDPGSDDGGDGLTTEGSDDSDDPRTTATSEPPDTSESRPRTPHTSPRTSDDGTRTTRTTRLEGGRSMTYAVTESSSGSSPNCLTFEADDGTTTSGCFGPNAPLAAGRTIVADTGDRREVWQVVIWNDDAGMITADDYGDAILDECADVIDAAIVESGVAVVDCPFNSSFHAARVVPATGAAASVYASTADGQTVEVFPVSASSDESVQLRIGRLPADNGRCVVVDSPLHHRWAEACGQFAEAGSLAAVVADEVYVVDHGADLAHVELVTPDDPSPARYRCRGTLAEVLSPLGRLGAMVTGIGCSDGGDTAIVSTAPVALSDGPPSAMWHELRRTGDGAWAIARSGIPPDCGAVADLCSRFDRTGGDDPFANARPITTS